MKTKTLLILFLLLAVTAGLSGCGHYGMGHHNMNDTHYEQNRDGSQYMHGNYQHNDNSHIRY